MNWRKHVLGPDVHHKALFTCAPLRATILSSVDWTIHVAGHPVPPLILKTHYWLRSNRTLGTCCIQNTDHFNLCFFHLIFTLNFNLLVELCGEQFVYHTWSIGVEARWTGLASWRIVTEESRITWRTGLHFPWDWKSHCPLCVLIADLWLNPFIHQLRL